MHGETVENFQLLHLVDFLLYYVVYMLWKLLGNWTQSIVMCILKIETSWRLLITFTFQLLYLH